jgi:phosphatidylglycerol:prolipoprotein diacylglycerol transferase
MPKKRKQPRSGQSAPAPKPHPSVIPRFAAVPEHAPYAPRRTQPGSPGPALFGPSPVTRRQSVTTVVPDEGPRPGDHQVEFVGMPFSMAAEMDPQALGITYRFTSPPGEPCPPMRLTVRGKRRGPQFTPGPTAFTFTNDVPALHASGETTVTMRALDIAAGDWQVSIVPELLGPAAGWQPPRASGQGRTGYAPIVRSVAPGVVIGAWPALVLLGVLLGTFTMTALAARTHLPTGQALISAFISSILGAAGAKAYFLVLHRDRQTPGLWQTGMAIQGFVLAALASTAATSALLSLPSGRMLDATVAGLLVGMTIGRIGCKYGGCCAGRPTPSRWGRWSSDRVIGIRRAPTQLLESAGAGLLATASGLFLWNDTGHPGGLVAVAGLAGYTLIRQVIFPFRDLPRTTRHGRVLVLAATAIAVASVVALIAGQD